MLVKTKDAGCENYLQDEADFTIEWVIGGEALVQKVKSLTLPDSNYYVWATGEGKLVKGLNDYFTVEQGLDPAYVRCVAYWHDK